MTIQNQVLNYLEDRPGRQFSVQEIARGIGETARKNTVSSALSKFLAQGKVKRVSWGVYTLSTGRPATRSPVYDIGFCMEVIGFDEQGQPVWRGSDDLIRYNLNETNR